MPYLLKTEPSEYSFADLQKDGVTLWDGITNAAALKNLREMQPGDRVVIYHTGEQRRAVGTGTVLSVGVKDPKRPQVKIRAGNALAHSVNLSEIRTNKAFAGSPLLRQGRLSVAPLSEEQFRILTEGR